jgi:hypothetical protein
MVLLVLVLLVLLVGCGGNPKAAPTSPPTPIGQLNTSQMNIPRVKFCDLIPADAVSTALGTTTSTNGSWANGDVIPLGSSPQDVVHEFGCRFTAGTSQAEAWVFARPVQPVFAQTVITQTATKNNCQSIAGPNFGQPSQRQTCELADGVVRVRFAGLFNQTWLTCQLQAQATAAEVKSRAGAWCVRVVNATNTVR